MHVRIALTMPEFEALQACARAERRAPSEQAAYLVSLIVMGHAILTRTVPTPSDPDPDPAPSTTVRAC